MLKLATLEKRDLMDGESRKWKIILNMFMASKKESCLEVCFRGGPTYKHKWNKVLAVYKCIVDHDQDYDKDIRINTSYSNMTMIEQNAKNQPQAFMWDI